MLPSECKPPHKLGRDHILASLHSQYLAKIHLAGHVWQQEGESSEGGTGGGSPRAGSEHNYARQGQDKRLGTRSLPLRDSIPSSPGAFPPLTESHITVDDASSMSMSWSAASVQSGPPSHLTLWGPYAVIAQLYYFLLPNYHRFGYSVLPLSSLISSPNHRDMSKLNRSSTPFSRPIEAVPGVETSGIKRKPILDSTVVVDGRAVPICAETEMPNVATVKGAPVDLKCPNVSLHLQRPVYGDNVHHAFSVAALQALFQGTDDPTSKEAVQCDPLGIQGSRGALFKLRTMPHGYTLVAKAVQPVHTSILQREARVYKNKVDTLMGRSVPVCLGTVEPFHPLNFRGLKWGCLLLLSFTKTSLQVLRGHGEKQRRSEVCSSARRALRHVHQHGILHGDIELRNIMCIPDNSAMLVDFELAKSREAAVRRALASTSGRDQRAGTMSATQGEHGSSVVSPSLSGNSKKRKMSERLLAMDDDVSYHGSSCKKNGKVITGEDGQEQQRPRAYRRVVKAAGTDHLWEMMCSVEMFKLEQVLKNWYRSYK